MADTTNQILNNWRGHLIPDMRGQTELVAEAMDRKLAEGMSVDSAVEILVACGMSLETVKNVAESRRMQIEAAIRATMPQLPEPEAEPPTGYGEVANRVASIVDGMPTEDVITLLAGNSKSMPSLVRLTEKQRAEFRSVVAMAKQTGDSHVVEALHKWVAPHVETAIADSEILAKKLETEGFEVTSADGEGDVVIREARTSRAYVVDPAGMTCTCPRYVHGGFAHTGLACEHILVARAAAQPGGVDSADENFVINDAGKRASRCKGNNFGKGRSGRCKAAAQAGSPYCRQHQHQGDAK